MAAEEGAVRRRVGAVLALHADASVPQQVQRRPQRRAVLAVLRLAERRERTGATSSTSLFNVTRGRIINISSVNVQKGQFGQTNYATAKTGIHDFTMSLAQEVATKGITVNTASPGYIGTDMVRAVKPEILDAIVQSIPVRRLGEASEIATIVSWLASERWCVLDGR